jgi:hypothetical protein
LAIVYAALGRAAPARCDPRVALVAGLSVWSVCAASIDAGHVGVVHDDGIYLVSARALRDGLPYGLPTRPGEPPPKYPIGLPLLIAGALKIAPGTPSLASDIAVARVLVVASGWVFFLGAFVWLRRLLVEPWAAACVVLATAFHHVTLVGGAATIFADLPFCAVTYVLFARWAHSGKRGVRGVALAPSFGDGVLSGLGMLLRSNGVTLALAALIAARFRIRRWPSVVSCALGIALVTGAASLYPKRPPHPVRSGDYSLELRAGWSSPAAGLRIVANNVGAVVRDFPSRVVLPNASYTAPVARLLAASPGAAWALRVVVGTAVLIGAASLARRSRPRDVPVWVHALGTLAIFAVWPWNSIMDRLLLSLFPIVLLCFATGAAALARRAGAGRGVQRGLAFACLTLALCGSASVAARAVMRFHAHGRQWDGASDRVELASALAYIRTLEPDAAVAATWPETVALYTGRQAFPLIEDDQLMLRSSGETRRLKRWVALLAGRPCYLLVRGREENPSGIDLRQAADLGADVRYGLHEIYRSAGGRYRVIAVEREAAASHCRSPGEAVRFGEG